MPFSIDVRNTAHPSAPAPAALRFQMGTIRPADTQHARDNWSSAGSSQRGWTKHHEVPWNTLKNFMNRAMLDLKDKQSDKLWNLIKKAAYVGGNASDNQAPLTAAGKYLKETVLAVPAGMADVADAQPVMPAAHWNAINDLGSNFCWMPGNFFLGPTPGSRLDDPGNDGYDMPPMGKGGKLAMALQALNTDAEAARWAEVAVGLDAIYKEGVAKRGKVINYTNDDWKIALLPGTAINTYKKKLA